MKIIKKALPITACLTLLSTPSQAALIIDFTEVGSNIVGTFSGSVNLESSFDFDSTMEATSGRKSRIDGNGIILPVRTRFVFGEERPRLDAYLGESLVAPEAFFVQGPFNAGPIIALEDFFGFAIEDEYIYVSSDLDGSVARDDVGNVSVLSADSGGALFGKTLTFAKSDVFPEIDAHEAGLEPHATDTLIDLWRVTGTTGDANLIQFRVNSPSGVPEPSSVSLLALGMVGLIARRHRKV